ncbi:relaxase/mobilization nuclease domain-containing protein [Pedobacter helvus]|uniref:Relaxase/mobilization nuclease domain-containing protein n=1 Tax=Pedobacter helvus TaxID=2563444 RepID=A0ABW9JEM4_9SPHI|nr:relaxase/mobilization nuclease domain-containing protein [Pedobacter ureilyticus]
MVARIITGRSIRGLLHYNENKVDEGEASLIMASGFAGEIERMNFMQKLNRFNFLTQMKPNVKTNAVHISLNFHSSERIGNQKLQQIAAAYMEKIDFGDQPFLVYRHDDSAHLHLHIVSTNITASKERIVMHDIGKNLSEPARKAIEEQFNLVKAESKAFVMDAKIKQADPKKVKYGKVTTKRAISNVVTPILREYKFTSLAEFNAVLKCFNVTALRGAEHTAMFKNRGLMFSLLNEKGLATGVPIKASSFYSKPTMASLEQKFEVNKTKRKPFREDLKKDIENVFARYLSITQSRFEVEAKKKGVDVLFRRNDQGQVFGITFIDHRRKTVFNGSDLGKEFSAKAIIERLGKENLESSPKIIQPLRQANRQHTKQPSPIETFLKPPQPTRFLELALAKTQPDYGTAIPRRKKKRKKNDQNQELTL